MVNIKLAVSILLVLGFTYATVFAQPFGLKGSEPEQAVKVVEKYMARLGNCRIEQADRLSDTTILFIVRAIDKGNVNHYIIATKYLEWKVIYDTAALD